MSALPKKRTLELGHGMSALCQKQTSLGVMSVSNLRSYHGPTEGRMHWSFQFGIPTSLTSMLRGNGHAEGSHQRHRDVLRGSRYRDAASAHRWLSRRCACLGTADS